MTPERKQAWPVRRPVGRLVPYVLGHSQIAVTMNTYGHVIPAMQQEAAGHVDAALGQIDGFREDASDGS
jgi:integrase